MQRRRLLTTLVVFVGFVLLALGLNLGFQRTPILGLDLQGGVSVILAPDTQTSDDDLIVIRDLIRDELEATGIAEPDVRVEGGNIVVDLPGVKDQQQALDTVDVAGIVSFRPVQQCLDAAPTGTDPSASTTPNAAPVGSSVPTDGSSPGSTPASTPVSAGSDATGAGFAAPDAAAPTDPTTPTEPDATDGVTTGTTPAPTGDTTGATAGSTPAGGPVTVPPGTNIFVPTTTINVFVPTTTTAPPPPTEVLNSRDGGACLVGPSGGSGELFARDSATVGFGDQWQVTVDFTGDGATEWNKLASECFNRIASCQSGQLAIVLDNIIQSAPTVRTPTFDPSQGVTITGGDETDARTLARVLNRGAFPVGVSTESVQTVSPTLGTDSLKAAVIAGVAGVLLVLLAFGFFYRSLTWLIVAGMVVWGMLIYSVSSFISESTNFALTLAGVTGIIIAIGVTVDSYVVYFERLKDEVRHGRTLRNSAQRAFTATWKTVLAADLVSILGAVVLFVLSVGSVRGFALYLGITTACDIVVFYFFTRPAVILTAMTGRLDRKGLFSRGSPA